MEIEQYTVHAFTDSTFGGNPACVCPLHEWLPDDLMQKIAAEFAVSETAFFVEDKDICHIRWFTPSVEMDLCGHATLASAYVIFTYLKPEIDTVRLDSASGELAVKKQDDIYYLDFPSRPAEPCGVPSQLASALGVQPQEVLSARDYLVLLDSEKTVRDLKPNIDMLGTLGKAVIVTALGNEVDFVSRFFAPTLGIAEDPVTGSSHCTLIPYWSEKLGKKEMTALQLSERGGKLFCTDHSNRVKIGGQAVTYLKGTIYL